jgi:hypothetical protein
VDSAVQKHVVAQLEAMLLAPLFDRLLPESDPLGGLGAELFARELASRLDRAR